MIRGEVRWYTFRPPDKRRPILILTRSSAINFLTNLTIAPLTSTIRDIPTEVVIRPVEDNVLTESAINLDNIQTVQKSKIGGLITVLSPEKMKLVDQALCFALGVD